MESVLSWISQYGYAGLFSLLMLGIVGLPVPDETLLVFCGYLIYAKRLHPVWAFVAAFGGSVCGISLSYLIGRTLGREAVTRYGKYLRLTPQHLDLAHAWFERIGEWLLAIGYFIPGVRHFTALVAGTSRLEYKTFAVFAYCGAALWVATFLTIGYIVGENWRSVIGLVHRSTLALSLLVIALAALAWWLHRRRVR